MSRRYRIVLSQRATHRLSRFCRQAAPVVLTLLFLPIAAYAQSGSPFDTGFTALQTLFTGTIAKVASLIAIVIGGYGFAHGEPGAKKALAGVAAGTELALGRMTHFAHPLSTLNCSEYTEGPMEGTKPQRKRINRVFKSLHKPLTYLGVERTLFFFICVSAVGAFNLFNSLLAGVAVFLGGFAFGHWVTNTDPALLRILAKSERYKLRYDAARQAIPQVEVR